MTSSLRSPTVPVDAEPGLAWDTSGGPHSGRVYLVYTLEHPNESNNTDSYVRYSDTTGATWGPAVRVNDDATVNRQFVPKISLDPTTGNIAVVCYDARNDLGLGGPGDTDGVPNDDAQFIGAFSTDGTSFTRNVQISAGTSNSHDAQNGIDYGDYSGLSFYGGIAHRAWADNSNSTGNNPDWGAARARHLYRGGSRSDALRHQRPRSCERRAWTTSRDGSPPNARRTPPAVLEPTKAPPGNERPCLERGRVRTHAERSAAPERRALPLVARPGAHLGS